MLNVKGILNSDVNLREYEFEVEGETHQPSFHYRDGVLVQRECESVPVRPIRSIRVCFIGEHFEYHLDCAGLVILFEYRIKFYAVSHRGVLDFAK